VRPAPALTVSAAAAIGALGGPEGHTPSPEAGARLDRETAALLAARQALDANDGAKALALLDKHDKDFPDGILGPDARMLRVEALAAAGKNADAVAAADAFLADFPHHPEAARIRGIRDRLKPPR
jgi:outer membrane protein assembly factor BamD (BamD/ComL family)